MRSQSEPDPAAKKVLATIADDTLAARYPNRTHFISASSPEQGEMATRALFAGDPVVIVHPDGHETLLRREHLGGIAALFLLFALFFLKRRSKQGDVIQLPPRTSIEARDSRGRPIAA
jgi:hypothetical protein